MTFREALVNAVDFLRASGSEDRVMILTARALERRAEKIRAKQEEPASWRSYCDCGERKDPKLNWCQDCYRAFPPALIDRWLLGKPKVSMKAWAEMKVISITRVQSEKAELEAAA